MPDNVTTIRVEKTAYAFESGENSAILGGVTVEIADGCTLTFAQTHHTLTLGAVTFTGAGTVSLPSLQPDILLGDWTGTVVLPSLGNIEGLNLNIYGKTGSTVAITGTTGGWLSPDNSVVAPYVRLDGNVSITAMSQRNYSFTKIS